ncbi:Histone-lysine N-methyltransferase [Bertholletia excelsa]
MAHVSLLPCNGDGICMVCKESPPDEEKLSCKTCFTPWHVSCLAVKPETLAATLRWECPDCEMPTSGGEMAPPAVIRGDGGSDELVAAVRAIEADTSLTEREKAKRRQELLSGRIDSSSDDEGEMKNRGRKKKAVDMNEIFEVVGKGLNCSFCMQLPERPVTTPCGHNFCLKCFQKWIGQGKLTCAKCRSTIPPEMAKQPRINSALVITIRMARMSKSNDYVDPDKIQYFVYNQDRPDMAYTTERAKKKGKANAASGKIFVTTPPDYFGPILPENDPVRNRGVLVGDWWEDRFECRQWGTHLPQISGICGQSKRGAQSVVLSGGYEDDEDHGEWFLYTGSGGRDLSGNKRTSKEQSSDQKFEKLNESLRVSCRNGYPVRVVRSHKVKCSSYAPENGLRYDGIYRIEKCWIKVGKQGFKVCRFLFVRCDNSPAPWTSDVHGDKVRALPAISELNRATDITERTESPAWDFDEEEGCWRWKRPPPSSKRRATKSNPGDVNQESRATAVRKAHYTSLKDRVLKELSCYICAKVMTLPLTTPCGHNFCKPCLEGVFSGKTFVRERTCLGGRTLRSQKNVMKCPSCPTDISEFLRNPQVNRELMSVIEGLQCKDEIDDDSVEGSGEKVLDLEEKISGVSSGIGENDIPHSEDEHDLKRKTSDGSLLKQPKRTNKRRIKEPSKTNKRQKINAGVTNDAKKENKEAEKATAYSLCI